MPETITKIFDAPDRVNLTIDNVEGPITVTGWDRPQTEVTATPHQDWVQVEISQQGSQVVARTKTEQSPHKWANWFSGSRAPRVEYAARVPYASDLEIKNVRGPITVRHCEGKIRVTNVDGQVTLDQAGGDIRLETVNGALSASNLQGAPHLKTVNGKLSVQESTLSGLSAHTVNGPIEAAATWDADAQISLHTVNGDCNLTVPADFRAKASAHGINVSVTDPQGKTINRQFSGWHGTIGPKAEPADSEPQAEIAFHTVNGHLRIHSGSPAGTTTQFAKQAGSAPSARVEPEAEPVQVKVAQAPIQEAPQEAQAAKTQLEILQAVERGEITVEEAIERLEG
jgi:hypothetical protein